MLKDQEMIISTFSKTLQDLEDITDAGSCCGSCKNEESDIGVEKMELYLEDILKNCLRPKKSPDLRNPP